MFMVNKVSVNEDCIQNCTCATEINKCSKILDAGMEGRVTVIYDKLNYITTISVGMQQCLLFQQPMCLFFCSSNK